MRTISKCSSTKPERIFIEILKKHHIPFKHRDKLNGHEVDFIIGKYAIEIDGHPQDSSRNAMLLALGFIPLHYHNNAVLNNRLEVERHIISLLKV